MLSIRPATTADIPNLNSLHRLVHDWHATQYPHVFEPTPSDAAIAEFFSSLLARDTTYIDIAFWDTAPAAYCFSTLSVHNGSALTKPRRHWHIEHIATDPAYRRKGIATALITRAEETARQQECTEINLSSWAANHAAHAAFHQNGFQTLRHWFAKPL